MENTKVLCSDFFVLSVAQFLLIFMLVLPEYKIDRKKRRICPIIERKTMKSENSSKLWEIWQKILRTIRGSESREQAEERFEKFVEDNATNRRPPSEQQRGD